MEYFIVLVVIIDILTSCNFKLLFVYQVQVRYYILPH